MADISISIRRDNGMYVTASGTVEDSLVMEIAQTLAAILFDASMYQAVVPVVDPTPPV